MLVHIAHRIRIRVFRLMDPHVTSGGIYNYAAFPAGVLNPALKQTATAMSAKSAGRMP